MYRYGLIDVNWKTFSITVNRTKSQNVYFLKEFIDPSNNIFTNPNTRTDKFHNKQRCSTRSGLKFFPFFQLTNQIIEIIYLYIQ